jgi:hypothetical protein
MTIGRSLSKARRLGRRAFIVNEGTAGIRLILTTSSNPMPSFRTQRVRRAGIDIPM